MALIGSMLEFDPSNDDWIIYQERLEQYFSANQITDEGVVKRQAATLLSLIGADTYKLLRDLCFPGLPKTKSYAELCKLLQEHFSPKISIYRERIKFYSTTQGQAESVSEWHARIKKLAVNCKFGAILDQVLCDKFVTGMRSGFVLDKMCEQDYIEDKKLNDLVVAALKKEASMQERSTPFDVRELRWADKEKNSRKVRPFGPRQTPTNGQQGSTYIPKGITSEQRTGKGAVSTNCKVCGKNHQLGQVCKFKHSTCFNCKMVGHIAQVCGRTIRGSNYRSIRSSNYVDAVVDDDLELPIFNFDLDLNKKLNPILATVRIEGRLTTMEVDSGAAISVISKDLYLEKFENCKLELSDIY